MSSISSKRLLSQSPDRDKYVELSRDLALASQKLEGAPADRDEKPEQARITGREMLLALALLCFMGTTFGLVLSTALAVFERPNASPLPCDASPPHSHAYDVNNFLDLHANPCSDIYQHACGGWFPFLSDMLDSSHGWSAEDDARYVHDLDIKRILTQSDTGLGTLREAKNFYKQCVDQEVDVKALSLCDEGRSLLYNQWGRKGRRF